MSLADAAPGLTVAAALPVHSAATGAGQVIVGVVVSCTRTLLVHELVLPHWPSAEYVRVVVPRGKEAGGKGVTVTGGRAAPPPPGPGGGVPAPRGPGLRATGPR